MKLKVLSVVFSETQKMGEAIHGLMFKQFGEAVGCLLICWYVEEVD